MLSFFTLENRKRNTKIVCDNIYEFIKDIPYILFMFVITVHASIYYCYRLWYYIY